MFDKFRSKVAALSLAAFVSVFAVSQPAMAALTLDTADIIADIGVVEVFIVTIGLAVLGMLFVAKGIKWARRAG